MSSSGLTGGGAGTVAAMVDRVSSEWRLVSAIPSSTSGGPRSIAGASGWSSSRTSSPSSPGRASCCGSGGGAAVRRSFSSAITFLIDAKMSSIDGSRPGDCIENCYRLLRRHCHPYGERRRLFRGDGAGRDRIVTGVVGPVVPASGDPAVVAEGVVERPALEPEIVGLGLAHRVQQLGAGDIGVAPGGHERDLCVQQ